jgi:hypothetical protein
LRKVFKIITARGDFSSLKIAAPYCRETPVTIGGQQAEETEKPLVATLTASSKTYTVVGGLEWVTEKFQWPIKIKGLI